MSSCWTWLVGDVIIRVLGKAKIERNLKVLEESGQNIQITESDIAERLVNEAVGQRQDVLRKIEEITKRNVINYSTSSYGFASEMMSQSDILNMSQVAVKKEGLIGIDLILNSPGGIPETAEKIITTLRNYYDDDFRVIVPETAKSAATVVALGSDEIVMGFCSELGPIDPQMQIPDGKGNTITRSAHAMIESVDRYIREAHQAVANDEPYHGFLRMLDFHPDITLIEECRLAKQLSEAIAKRWLSDKMLKDNIEKAASTAEALSRADELFSHGRAIDHEYAKGKLGLNIKYLRPGDPLWKLIWELHLRSQLCKNTLKVSKIIESTRKSLVFQ